VPCVVGRQSAEALSVIETKAQSLQAPLYRFGTEWQHTHGGYSSEKRKLSFKPALEGDYQWDNAATAIACLDLLPQFSISDAQLATGLANVRWPARLQRLNLAGLPAHVELWLDGGHNAQGGQVLADWLAQERQRDIFLICGMLKGKDARAFLAPSQPYVSRFWAIPIPQEPATLPAEALAELAKSLGFAAEAGQGFEKTLQAAVSHATKPTKIVICGSLYLAGKILAAMEKQHANHH